MCTLHDLFSCMMPVLSAFVGFVYFYYPSSCGAHEWIFKFCTPQAGISPSLDGVCQYRFLDGGRMEDKVVVAIALIC